MKTNKWLYIVSSLLLLAFIFIPGCATPQSFHSSNQAVDSLVDALRTSDQVRIHSILGPETDELLSSGDPVEDRNRIAQFLAEYDEKHLYILNEDGSVTLVIGNEQWPMPIPVVKSRWSDEWRFDVKAGKEEMLNRRIGGNELDAIQTCLALVDAQRDYAAMNPEHTAAGQLVYAQKFLSDSGKKNGLYWDAMEGEPPSPIGDAIVKAAREGYAFSAGRPQPYHGYYYRILKAQGPSAPGGAMDYIVDGKMVRGFALVAYPAEYANSGITTFIVNQLGVLYSCDLGADTQKIVSQMTTFDPDEKWWPVTDADTVIVPE